MDQLGVEARLWSLQSDGETTDRIQHEAIERLARTRLCVDRPPRT